MLFPAIGGAGIATKSGAKMVADVSTKFNAQTPSTVSTVLAADGSVLTSYYNQYRTPIPLDQMGKWVPKAIVAIEDKRFYQHNGFDTTGTIRALAQNVVSGGVSQGGSTITQQLVKNTLLYQAKTQAEQKAATEQTLGRKLKEAKIAIELEKKLSKDQILEKYLNLMNMGAGAYGVRAAAITYFGVEPANLTVDQAALLAGIVQNPTKFNPFNNPKDAKKRRDIVLSTMIGDGTLTKSEGEDAMKKPLTLNPGAKPGRSCSEAPSNGGFFCDYLWTYLTKTLGIPSTLLKEQGLTVKSTFQPSFQDAATNGILGASQALGRSSDIFGLGDQRIAVMDVLDATNGNVLALGVNKKFGNDANDASQTSNNFPSILTEGAGSTYKLFTAVAGLESGVGVNFVTGANAPYTSKKFKNGNKPYVVNNAGKYAANLPLWKALYQSENTYFVGLEDHLGSVDPVVDAATAMGLWAPGDTAAADKAKAEQQGSFTLGPLATNPLRLAVAYATTANRGTRCEPVPVTDILGPDGQPLINPKTKKPYFTPGTNCTANAIPPGVADTINDILLKDVMPGNSGQTAARAYTGDGRQIAGKSGTAQDNASYAFVGYTPQVVASVMAFNPKNNDPLPSPGGGEEGFGGGYPAMMWKLAMQNILNSYPKISFPPADPKVEAGNTVKNPVDCVGKTPAQCKSDLSKAGLKAADSGTPVDNGSVPAGLVGAQSPAAGQPITPGSIVTYSISTGKAPAGQPCAAGQDPATGCIPPTTPTPNPAPTPCQPGQDPATTGCVPGAQPGGAQPGGAQPGGSQPGNNGNGNGNGGNGNGNGNGG
ncbi:membrane peptidoglycan carboxypeptidase [Antricoccus suffuscus]|uniref:Membrane peptidoglycan carboxypeptidase n=2 Tax=Antricoccus suffuscus TaxID=1629062 RepID=A0A2T1A3K6_9ACTN|nr:membrane peptidoglycan carboxypeptidase [Antricoccus suffuscus]